MKVRVLKGNSKHHGWQNTQNGGCLCDLGRKLENLSMPVYFSDVLPRMAEQGFTSHGRLVERRSRQYLFHFNQA